MSYNSFKMQRHMFTDLVKMPYSHSFKYSFNKNFLKAFHFSCEFKSTIFWSLQLDFWKDFFYMPWSIMRRRIVLYLTYVYVRMYFQLLVNHIFIGMLKSCKYLICMRTYFTCVFISYIANVNTTMQCNGKSFIIYATR